MDENDALLYLNNNYPDQFKKPVTLLTLRRWLKKGNIKSLDKEHLDKAIEQGGIPPKRGRPPKFSECDKDDIIAACDHMSQGEVAKRFGCDPSYVSLIVRGLR